MKKIFLYGLVLLVVVFGATMAFVPAARAQVTGWVSGQVAEFAFGTSAGMPKVSLISAGPWGFEPLNPTYLPRGSWVIVPDSYPDQDTGLETLKLTINQGDRFVILTQRKALPGEPLPEGTRVQVNDRPAVIVNDLTGEVDARIPLDKEHGGVQPEPSGQVRLSSIAYTEGVRLTWQIGEIRLEILSNLSQKQVLKIAASLLPVETGPAEMSTTQP